jgi:thymidine kinase
MSFKLEIILGPMFSGKSTELLRRTSRYEAIGKKIFIINHSNDTRTTNFVKTHSNITKIAVKTDKLMSLVELVDFKESDIIGIDEAQFFEDLYEFIIYIENTDKIVIISGLDGDYQRKPFGKILYCIPLCDTVTKLSAMCMKSKDGTPAIFSKRIINKNDQTLVGDKDTYIAVNRSHYLNN